MGGLNVTFRIGAGYGNWSVTYDSDADAQQVVEAVDDLLTLLRLLWLADFHSATTSEIF